MVLKIAQYTIGWPLIGAVYALDFLCRKWVLFCECLAYPACWILDWMGRDW